MALVSNADGAVLRGGDEVLSRLVNQVSNPVRWDLCMDTIAEMGVTGLIELPPAGTLVGLAKRGLQGRRDPCAEDARRPRGRSATCSDEHGGQPAGSPSVEQEA